MPNHEDHGRLTGCHEPAAASDSAARSRTNSHNSVARHNIPKMSGCASGIRLRPTNTTTSTPRCATNKLRLCR